MSLGVEIRRRFGRYDVELRYGGTPLMWTITEREDETSAAAARLLEALADDCARLREALR